MKSYKLTGKMLSDCASLPDKTKVVMVYRPTPGAIHNVPSVESWKRNRVATTLGELRRRIANDISLHDMHEFDHAEVDC